MHAAPTLRTRSNCALFSKFQNFQQTASFLSSPPPPYHHHHHSVNKQHPVLFFLVFYVCLSVRVPVRVSFSLPYRPRYKAFLTFVTRPDDSILSALPYRSSTYPTPPDTATPLPSHPCTVLYFRYTFGASSLASGACVNH